MGVKGLESFVEQNCPEACKRVRIADVVNRFRCESDDVWPTLAVDAMGMLHKINGNLDPMLGGQWKELEECVASFLRSLRRLRVQPVFFFDGTTVSNKRQQWIQRRLEDLKEYRRIMAHVRRTGQEPERRMLRKALVPPGTGIVMRMVLKFTFNCDVRTTIRECDLELEEYVRTTPYCCGLLSQDSDFLIYRPHRPYLSIRHLDLERMETVYYDVAAAAQYLGLFVDQLPLFACLKGNDVVDQSLLQQFHSRLSGGRRPANDHALIRLVADYVRSLPYENFFDDHLQERLEEISNDVFGHSDHVELLAKALYTYDVPVSQEIRGRDTYFNGPFTCDHSPRVVNLGLQWHQQTENVPYVFSILRGFAYESSTALEDDADRELPPSALLYRPVRQRTYGPLIEPLGRSHVEEWCVYGENPLRGPDLVERLPLVLSGGKSATMKDLWLLRSKKVCWGAYCACFGTTFDAEEARSIPPSYVALCTILNYLVQNTRIAAWEVTAFIAQAVHPMGQGNKWLSQMKVESLTVRVMSLGTIFMRGVSMVMYVNGVCGNPLRQATLLPSGYFNGRLFYLCYGMASQGAFTYDLCDQSAEASEELMRLFGVVTAKTRLSGCFPSKMSPEPSRFLSRIGGHSSDEAPPWRSQPATHMSRRRRRQQSQQQQPQPPPHQQYHHRHHHHHQQQEQQQQQQQQPHHRPTLLPAPSNYNGHSPRSSARL